MTKEPKNPWNGYGWFCPRCKVRSNCEPMWVVWPLNTLRITPVCDKCVSDLMRTGQFVDKTNGKGDE